MKTTLQDKLNDPKSDAELRHLMTRIYMEEVAREAVRREVQALPDDILREMVDRVVLKLGVNVEDVKALLPADGMTKGAFVTKVYLELGIPKSAAAELLEEGLALKVVRAYSQKNAVLITHGVAPGLDWVKIFDGGGEVRGPVIRDRMMVMTGKSKPWVQAEITKAVKDGVLSVVKKEGREQVLSLVTQKKEVDTSQDREPPNTDPAFRAWYAEMKYANWGRLSPEERLDLVNKWDRMEKKLAKVPPAVEKKNDVPVRYPHDDDLPPGFEEWAEQRDYADAPWGYMAVKNGNRAWAEWKEMKEKERREQFRPVPEENRFAGMKAMLGGQL